jgi:hypothetical protein
MHSILYVDKKTICFRFSSLFISKFICYLTIYKKKITKHLSCFYFIEKKTSYVIIGNDIFFVYNLYLISVEIVGCCNRLITSFNGAFFTLIIDDEIGDDGKRMREGDENFCLQVDDSSTM